MEQRGRGRGVVGRGRGRGVSAIGPPQQRAETIRAYGGGNGNGGNGRGNGGARQMQQPMRQHYQQQQMQAPGQALAPRPLGMAQAGVGEGPRAPTPSVAGRASVVTDEKRKLQQKEGGSSSAAASGAAATGDGSGGGGDGAAGGGEKFAAQEGRGMIRGKRVITEHINTRPKECVSKMGKEGTTITVQANYFRINKKPEWSIHQYRVDFSPEVDALAVRRAYLNKHREKLGGFIFDGTVMFSSTYLRESPLELPTINRENETILIKIRHVGIVDTGDSQKVQVLNLILRRAMEGLELQLVGRNFFDSKAKIDLSQYKMEIWPGYVTSIRQHERDILLCCEVSHKVMRTDSLYTILSVCTREESNPQDAFKRQVVGSIVLTDYNNKTYRVDDVDFTLSPKSTFETKNGPLSYVDYYKKRYGLTIRDLKQPLLVSRPTERNIRGGENQLILLVPELSRATGMTDSMRANFRLMKAMGEHTRLNPERRIERLQNFNRRLQDSTVSVESFSRWSMELDRNLIEIPARLLPNEKILFGNNGVYKCNNSADWTREFRNNKMMVVKHMKRWICIVPERNIKEVQNFVQMCIRAARGMGMDIANPKYQTMPDDRNNSYSQAIDTAVALDPQILMVVLVKQNEEKYSCIKKKCCVDRPIPSQCCILPTIAPRAEKSAGLMSVATKVVIQMNAKLMGTPWLVDIPPSGVMFVGFDVCHSAKEKNKSFGALVATMDLKSSSAYFSNVMQHLKGQELSNEIAVSMTMALRAYRDEHGTLPERIIFYRDGVGDGQLHQVVNTEVNFIAEKLHEIYAATNKPCKFAFIIVTKRINTRFFTNRKNPEPGTVVDDVVTLPERYDFFLVSQSVRQGTVSPTCYNVIHDNLGWSADRIQMLTYKLTHLYYNWSGTCRVPAVCQYAHKLATLVAEFIHRNPSNALERQLYFL